jgi:hypothetical protein
VTAQNALRVVTCRAKPGTSVSKVTEGTSAPSTGFRRAERTGSVIFSLVFFSLVFISSVALAGRSGTAIPASIRMRIHMRTSWPTSTLMLPASANLYPAYTKDF